MLRKLAFGAVLSAAIFAMSCGTSTHGPAGSFHQTQTGVSETGYPGTPDRRTDAESPALSSATEVKYSQPISEATAPRTEAKAETKTETK
jgi:hypothetical protein